MHNFWLAILAALICGWLAGMMTAAYTHALRAFYGYVRALNSRFGPFPRRVQVGPGQWFPVVEANLPDDKLGCFDQKAQTIYLQAGMSTVERWTILLHELIHVSEDSMLQAKIIKRRLGEKVVTNLAGTLGLILAASGCMEAIGVTEQDALACAEEDEEG